jgi:hypothetical protein
MFQEGVLEKRQYIDDLLLLNFLFSLIFPDFKLVDELLI